MRDFLKGLIAFLAAFILQQFLQQLFPGIYTVPNLILCLAAVMTYIYDDNIRWMALGVGFALVMDITYGLFVGVGMLTMLIVEVGILIFKYYFNSENMLNSIVLAVLTTWVYATVYWLISTIAGSSYSYLYVMKSIPLEVVFNAVAFMIIYLIMIRKVTPHRTDRFFG
jgi:hypothetical protein